MFSLEGLFSLEIYDVASLEPVGIEEGNAYPIEVVANANLGIVEQPLPYALCHWVLGDIFHYQYGMAVGMTQQMFDISLASIHGTHPGYLNGIYIRILPIIYMCTLACASYI